MAEVLCVYREVQVLKKAAAKAEKSKKPVAIVSYDEKPGIQAIATTAPDLPPVPGRHASFARDHEYKRQPETFEDDYEQALREIIEKKAKGEKIERPKQPARSNVVRALPSPLCGLRRG